MVLDLKSLKEELDFERKLEWSTAPKSETAVTGVPEPATSSKSRARPTINDRSFIVGKKAVIAAIVLVISVGAAYLYFIRSAARTIDSIAVLPFTNASGNSELEYLSEGMTDSLINSLSQLPNLFGQSSQFSIPLQRDGHGSAKTRFRFISPGDFEWACSAAR